MATVEQKPPRTRPLHRRLGETAAGNAGAWIVLSFVVAALASSRAVGHSLSPTALVGVVTVAAAASGLMGSIAGAYGGAAEVLTGVAELDCSPHCPAAPTSDPFLVPALWRTAWRWAAVAGAWALAAGGLVAVVLNGKHAGLGVMFITIVGLSGCAAVVADTVARHRGAHAARRLLLEPPVPVPLRRRAWRQIALRLAVVPTLVSGLFAWVLFHDYAVHQPFAAKALTRSVVLNDTMVTVVLLAVVFTVLYARPWGEVDARLGHIRLEDAEVQTVTVKAPIGAQGVIYAALACWLSSVVLGWLLPSNPALWQAMVARGAYAGLLTFVFSGLAYVRGAVNALAVDADDAAATEGAS
jgi:hypothetical protein